jgi:hypothetical protein
MTSNFKFRTDPAPREECLLVTTLKLSTLTLLDRYVFRVAKVLAFYETKHCTSAVNGEKKERIAGGALPLR